MGLHRFDVIHVCETVGIPETPSLIVNTWHFNPTVAPTGTDYDNVRDILQDFYQGVIDAGAMAMTYVDLTAIRAYDLADTKPRSPVYESLLTLTGGATPPLPSECAMVFTFEAERTSGTIRARRRNRKYLAPISQVSINNDGRFSGFVRNLVAEAGRDMLNAAAAAVSWDWVIYSGTLDQTFGVEDGYIDDAADTQRRRSFGPLERSEFSSSLPV